MAGRVYGPLIAEQMAAEQARKVSLEQRGLAVISTSGVLVSLLFGLGAVALPSEADALPPVAVGLLVAFVVAAGFGLAANRPRTYAALAVGDMRRMVSAELWGLAEGPAARRVAENRVELVAVSRAQNASKARLVQRAVMAETVGVGLVALAVADLLIQRG